MSKTDPKKMAQSLKGIIELLPDDLSPNGQEKKKKLLEDLKKWEDKYYRDKAKDSTTDADPKNINNI